MIFLTCIAVVFAACINKYQLTTLKGSPIHSVMNCTRSNYIYED